MAEKLKILSNDQIEEYRRNSNKKNLSDQERYIPNILIFN